jgi:hypothetical protein
MTRDEIMHLANACAGQQWMDEAHMQRFAALAVAAEREACAKVCEDLRGFYKNEREHFAAAIRKRGEK